MNGWLNDARHGPLPPLLLCLTAVAGAVDAISYLGLGHVFVANMTGNIVFIGFAAAGAHGVSLGSSLLALAAFTGGAACATPLTARVVHNRGHLLATASAFMAVIAAVALVVAGFSGLELDPLRGAIVTTLLSITMGLQTAIARRLAVPDMPTSVLTLTITGLVADWPAARSAVNGARRRLVSVFAMLVGAFAGAACLVHAGISAALFLVAALFAVTAVFAFRFARRSPAWAQPLR